MTNIDGYRLLGRKPGDGELYDLGWVQIDRRDLTNTENRQKAIDHLKSFATGRSFADDEMATDLSYVWGHTYDRETHECVTFQVPHAVNHDPILMLPLAPDSIEVVNTFLSDIVQVIN